MKRDLSRWNNIRLQRLGRENRQRYPAGPPSLTKDSIDFFVPLQRHLSLAQMWMRRGCTHFCPTPRPSPCLLPTNASATQPPVDEKWIKKQRGPLFYSLLGVGVNMAYTSKNKNKREALWMALTPNRLSDNRRQPSYYSKGFWEMSWEAGKERFS